MREEYGVGLKIAPATLSFHLKELSHAGLVLARQDGRFIFYSANYARMDGLLGYLTQNCCARDGMDCATGCGVKQRAPTTRRARRGVPKP